MNIPENSDQQSSGKINGDRTGKRVSAALFSKLLIDAMDDGNVSWVLRRLSEIERQLSEKGSVLDFDHCEGIRSMAQETRDRLLEMGRRDEANELAEAFGKYFTLDAQGQ